MKLIRRNSKENCRAKRKGKRALGRRMRRCPFLRETDIRIRLPRLKD